MSSKTKYRRAQPTDFDDKDSVLAGVDFNVLYLGSQLVPTFNGHGSSNTEVVVDRLYQENYKPFSFSSKIRVTVQISSEKIAVIETIDRERKEVATFPISTLTFGNIDFKHDRAFVYIAREGIHPTFRAYVFHCESSSKARDMVKIFNEAVTIKGNLEEVNRVRALSSPQPYTVGNVDRVVYDPNSPTARIIRETEEPTQVKSVVPKPISNIAGGRMRSWTEIPTSSVSPQINIQLFDRRQESVTNQQAINTSPLIEIAVEDDEDEFTQLAKKRTSSCNFPNNENTCFLEKMQTQRGRQITTSDNVNLLEL